MDLTIAQTLHTLIFDFDGVFTDNSVIVSENGEESVICDRRDGLGINLLRSYCYSLRHEIRLLILSKERNSVVATRASKLGIDVEYGVDNKAEFIATFLERYGHIKDSQVYKGLAYCGNDINDLGAIKLSEYSFAPSDSHPTVKESVTRVLAEPGGRGFVRRVVEILIGLDNMTHYDIGHLLNNSQVKH